MRKLFVTLAFCLLATNCFAFETSLTSFSEPSNVTITATNLSFTYVTSTQNSACAWTMLRGSNQSSTFSKRWYVYNPSAYVLHYAYYYVNLTASTAIPNDVGYIAASGGSLERRLSIPNGIYIHTTFTTAYSGTVPTITIRFESEK